MNIWINYANYAYSFFLNNFLNNHRIWKIKPALKSVKSGLTCRNVKCNLLLKRKIDIFNEMHNYANEATNFVKIIFSDSGFFSGAQWCFPFVNPWSSCQVMIHPCGREAPFFSLPLKCISKLTSTEVIFLFNLDI